MRVKAVMDREIDASVATLLILALTMRSRAAVADNCCVWEPTYNHVLAPDTLAQHLLSGPKGIDLLLTAVFDCNLPGNAVMHLHFELPIKPGHCSCHFSLQCLPLVLSLCQLSWKLFK